MKHYWPRQVENIRRFNADVTFDMAADELFPTWIILQYEAQIAANRVILRRKSQPSDLYGRSSELRSGPAPISINCYAFRKPRSVPRQ